MKITTIYENDLEALEKMGITIKTYGGSMLRKLASEDDMERVVYFVEKGADINYHESDMIFPYERLKEKLKSHTNTMIEKLSRYGKMTQ